MEPASNEQLSFITGLAQDLIVGYESIEDLNDLIRPIYRCDFEDLNKGQASMLIEDMLNERDELGKDLGYPSIFEDPDEMRRARARAERDQGEPPF
jgi:hypothetical protein